MNYSTRAIGQYNRNRQYKIGVSSTLLAETVCIPGATAQVVIFADQPQSWYVASRTNRYHGGEAAWPRYYKFCLDAQGRAHCSSPDDRTQAYCKAAVAAYLVATVRPAIYVDEVDDPFLHPEWDGK